MTQPPTPQDYAPPEGVEYTIVVEDSWQELTASVQEGIRNGWLPVGGVSADSRRVPDSEWGGDAQETRWVYCQAMAWGSLRDRLFPQPTSRFTQEDAKLIREVFAEFSEIAGLGADALRSEYPDKAAASDRARGILGEQVESLAARIEASLPAAPTPGETLSSLPSSSQESSMSDTEEPGADHE